MLAAQGDLLLGVDLFLRGGDGAAQFGADAGHAAQFARSGREDPKRRPEVADERLPIAWPDAGDQRKPNRRHQFVGRFGGAKFGRHSGRLLCNGVVWATVGKFELARARSTQEGLF